MRTVGWISVMLIGCATPPPALPSNSHAGETPLFEVPRLYADLFDEGAVFHFAGEREVPGDDAWSMRCQVFDVTRRSTEATAELRCEGAAADSTEDPILANVAMPTDVYTATGDGLWRAGVLLIPSDESARESLAVSRQVPGVVCASQLAADEQEQRLCFRPGFGLIGGEVENGRYELESLERGHDAARSIDIDNAVQVVEVHAAGTDNDWFAVINASSRPVDLVGYLYSDRADPFERSAPFDREVLAPGARHVQRVIRGQAGFQLNGGGETISIFRLSDFAVTDRVTFDRTGAIRR